MAIIERRAEHKVKDGKLLRCTLELDGNTIVNVRITGDFFMHPEESIVEMENIIRGTELDKRILMEKITKFHNNGIRIIGAKIDDFVTLLMKCGNER
ncbi:MAG: lipoate protein ligase C-terminal domain-containing protein [Thermoplasmata archaeon]